MSTVTYYKQPGIHKTRGTIPLAGNSHVYQVSGILWPKDVEDWIAQQIMGTSLHICCGKSQLGDVRLDLLEDVVDVRADAARLPFSNHSFSTVIIDPPYNGSFRWNHDMLNELHRVASERIIFQHWFSPVDKDGRFKKNHQFTISDAKVVPVMPANANTGFRLASKTVDGYIVIEDDELDTKEFILNDLVYWQPRSYFGRVQLISILDRTV